jgi:hypothetical protein
MRSPLITMSTMARPSRCRNTPLHHPALPLWCRALPGEVRGSIEQGAALTDIYPANLTVSLAIWTGVAWVFIEGIGEGVARQALRSVLVKALTWLID